MIQVVMKVKDIPPGSRIRAFPNGRIVELRTSIGETRPATPNGMYTVPYCGNGGWVANNRTVIWLARDADVKKMIDKRRLAKKVARKCYAKRGA